MKKIFIPPVLLGFSVIIIVMLNIFVQEYNIIGFPFNLIGIIVIIMGFLPIIKAKDSFTKYKTTHTFSDPSHLIIDGIFAKSRNPVYLGYFVMLLGFALANRNILAMIIPFCNLALLNFYFIPFEEKMLERIFGNEYLDYKSKVKRWFGKIS